MTKALLHELGKSLSFGRLSLKGKVLWPMLLASSDDQGRGTAESDAIKWHVCPNVDEITISDVPDLLAEMGQQGMILLYDCEAGHAYQALHWWEYQQLRFARPSRWQAPEGWTDRIHYSNRGDMHSNDGWATTGGFDAEPVEAAKTRSGKKPPPIVTENCTETSQNSLENSNPTEPNQTQPNLTEPNSTPSGPGVAASVTVTPEDAPKEGASQPPTPLRHLSQEEIRHPDAALLEAWRELQPEILGQMQRATYDDYVRHISPVCIKDRCVVFLTEREHVAQWCNGRLKIPLQRTLAHVLDGVDDFSVALRPQPGGT